MTRIASLGSMKQSAIERIAPGARGGRKHRGP
jgi:hypothetical protein